MRKVQWLLCVVCVPILVAAGCGGGGNSGGGTPTQSVQVTLTVPPGAAPQGVNPTATVKTTADPGYEKLQGRAVVAAVQCDPPGTVFTQPVTLTFKLVTALDAGDVVELFWCDAQNNWNTLAGAQETISADRLTVTVSNISQFTDNGRYALLKVVP